MENLTEELIDTSGVPAVVDTAQTNNNAADNNGNTNGTLVDDIASDFPKPLTETQRADLKSQLVHLHRATEKLTRARSGVVREVRAAFDAIENSRKTIASLKGEEFVAGERPAVVAEADAAIAAAKARREAIGLKRKREGEDDGKEARAEEEAGEEAEGKEDAPVEEKAPEAAASPAEEPAKEKQDESGDKPAEKTEDAKPAEKKEEKPAVRQRATITKGKGFAFLQGFLKGAVKEREGLSTVQEQRNKIAKQAQLESQERDLAAQQDTLAKKLESAQEVATKIETIAAEKLKYQAANAKVDVAETKYCASFALTAKGPLYPITFAPAKHSEKSMAALQTQLSASSTEYLAYRADVDPLLEVINARKVELAAARDQRKASRTSGQMQQQSGAGKNGGDDEDDFIPTF